MTPDAMASLPAQFVAGDTWKWCKAVHDRSPNQGDSLAYLFRGAAQLDVEGDPDGQGGWSFNAAAADTAGLPAGSYSWQARITNGDEVATIDSGTLIVKAGFTSVTTPLDNRTSAEKQLAAVESALEKLLTKTNSSVSFGDQSYTLQDADKLSAIRDRLRNEVAAARGRGARKILVHFLRP